MLDALVKEGVEVRRISAKMAGGANMFAATGPFQIGHENAEAARRQLGTLRIPIVGEHLGGTQGRRVYFEPDTSSLLVEIAGQTQVVL
jgi:chemotaxis protein CheD